MIKGRYKQKPRCSLRYLEDGEFAGEESLRDNPAVAINRENRRDKIRERMNPTSFTVARYNDDL